MHLVAVPGLHPLDPERIPWRATRVEGVRWLPLFLEDKDGRTGDSAARGGSAVLIRMEPGRGYPRHEHAGVEEVLCLAGGYADELGTVRAGDYVRYEAGSAHAPVALAGGPCVLYAIARGGILLAP